MHQLWQTCSQGYCCEELLAEQFLDLVKAIQLRSAVVAWANEVLKQSLEEETEYHNKTVARLNGELEQIKRRMNQAYLDKLDGRIDEEFWAECSAQWQAEKARAMEKLARHGQADSAYLDEGARLIDVASRAVDLYQRHGLVERRGFLASILENVQVKDGRVTAQYRQAFKILSRMAAATMPPPSAGARGRRSSKVAVWGG